MPYTPPQVQRVIDRDYNFNFGEYISEAFNLVTRNFGPILGFMLVWTVISSVIGFIPLLGPVAYNIVVGPCLLAGFYIAADKSYNNEYLDFGLFFKGFDKVGQLALMSLIKWLLLLAALIPAGILFFVMMDMGIDPENGDDAVVMVALGFFAMLPFFYLLLSQAFAPLFIMFYDMEPWHAMEASRKVITQKWFLFFALAFVGGLIAMLGALAIFIGMLFTFPVYMAMTYTAFRDIVGMPEVKELRAMDHFID